MTRVLPACRLTRQHPYLDEPLWALSRTNRCACTVETMYLVCARCQTGVLRTLCDGSGTLEEIPLCSSATSRPLSSRLQGRGKRQQVANTALLSPRIAFLHWSPLEFPGRPFSRFLRMSVYDSPRARRRTVAWIFKIHIIMVIHACGMVDSQAPRPPSSPSQLRYLLSILLSQRRHHRIRALHAST